MKNRLRESATTDDLSELSLAFRENVERLPGKVFVLRQKLYLKAKREPGFRFYALIDRIWRKDVLAAAWKQVARNGGRPGVDGMSIKDVKSRPDGVEGFLDEIQESLKSQTYRSQPVLRKYIRKENGKERPLGIPTVRDRVVQAATKLILEPIFEADFKDSSYGFRPKRSAHDALDKIGKHLKRGRTSVYDADLAAYFDTIPHDRLMKVVERRISDRRVLSLIRMWLRTLVEEPPREGGGGPRRHRPKAGTPQGGVISPLLANAYLHWLDLLFMRKDGPGVWANARIVRYADDFVVMARVVSPQIKQWLENLLEGRMGLRINREKTSLLRVSYKADNLDFLGYTFRWNKSNHEGWRPYLQTAPSEASVLRAKVRIRDLTDRRYRMIPIDQLIRRVNRFLIGWRGYFEHGYSYRTFRKLDRYAYSAVYNHLRKRSQRRFKPPKGCSYYELIYKRMGLIRLAAKDSR